MVLNTKADAGALDDARRSSVAPVPGTVPARGPRSDAAGMSSIAASRMLRIPIALIAEARTTGKIFRSRNALCSPATILSCGISPFSKKISINASSLSATISTSLAWYSFAMSARSAGKSPVVDWPEPSFA
jgi:hypothetical protein